MKAESRPRCGRLFQNKDARQVATDNASRNARGAGGNGGRMATVFVTGGSRGIGAAVVRALAPRGNVAFTYNASEDAALALERELAAYGGVKAFRCDVRDARSVAETAAAVRARFGAPEAVVNCAGVSLKKLFQDTSEEDWREVFAVNCDGAYRVSRAFLPDMLTRKNGAIVNVSSVWGKSGASLEVAYSASKAALEGMTRALAKEVALSGVRVNAVAPGAVDTDMMKSYSAEEIALVEGDIPFGRLASPDEIAAAVLFLLDNGYITGQTLTVDGGFTL